ncbi:MAG: hypothetical protein C5B53_08785 [Candidatus Melainabacteria bacterium]|nr:MAG: hypothetical protein C5B53_08785 [Candidatus Melainabacteria bacterium]
MTGDTEEPRETQFRDTHDYGHSVKSRDPLIGTTLDGRFVIEEVLGTGGISIVYKAKQLRVDRPVAIKTLQLRVDTKPVYRERFQREISSLCKLSHPNIVTVFDCIIGEDDQPYIVMDYLSGRSLEALIKDNGPLDIERFARISIQICGALDHAHRKGIVHRDLKPGNIVLMDDEMDFVKVVDFGLAKIGEEGRKLTQSGELWGSPPYMSPEQCMGGSVDLRSDIYSLGILMYEMLAGQDPFHEAVTVFELIQKHVSTQPPRLSEVNPQVVVPPALESVIFKALEKDREQRYQSGQQLQNAILEACSKTVDRHVGEFLTHLANESRSTSSEQRAKQEQLATDSNPNVANYFNQALNPMAYEETTETLSSSIKQKPPKPEATQPVETRPSDLAPVMDKAIRKDAPQVSRLRNEPMPSPTSQGRSFTVLIAVLAGAVLTICILILIATLNKPTTTVHETVPGAETPNAVIQQQTPTSSVGTGTKLPTEPVSSSSSVNPKTSSIPTVTKTSANRHIVQTHRETEPGIGTNLKKRPTTLTAPRPHPEVEPRSKESSSSSDPWSALNKLRKGTQ